MGIQPKVVLVAEDDDFIREIVTDLLSENGHVVLQVANAAQALEILRESSHKVDLLFTDVKMPGRMDGMELAALVAATWPDIRILIASGHIRPTPAEIPARSLFIPKPYTADVMDQAIMDLFLADAPAPQAARAAA